MSGTDDRDDDDAWFKIRNIVERNFVYTSLNTWYRIKYISHYLFDYINITCLTTIILIVN